MVKETYRCPRHAYGIKESRCSCPQECENCGATYVGEHFEGDCIEILKNRLSLYVLEHKIAMLSANHKPATREELISVAKADVIANLEKTNRLTENIRRIKQTVEWFPGLILGLERRSGKTTAILEMMRERDNCEAFYFTANQRMCDQALYHWVGETKPFNGKYERLKFVFGVQQVRGSNWPIYVDEWWMLSEIQQKEIMETGRVICRLGTER